MPDFKSQIVSETPIGPACSWYSGLICPTGQLDVLTGKSTTKNTSSTHSFGRFFKWTKRTDGRRLTLAVGFKALVTHELSRIKEGLAARHGLLLYSLAGPACGVPSTADSLFLAA